MLCVNNLHNLRGQIEKIDRTAMILIEDWSQQLKKGVPIKELDEIIIK